MSNTSKEMMCFSDFPAPADYPNYMHSSQILQYLRLYAENFDLLQCIHFQVVPLTPHRDDHCHQSCQRVSKLSLCAFNAPASDDSEECYTEARFFSVGSVGRGHRERRWDGGEARLRCRSGVFGPLHSSGHTSLRLPRLVNKGFTQTTGFGRSDALNCLYLGRMRVLFWQMSSQPGI